MKKKPPSTDASDRMATADDPPSATRFVLRLYVAGTTPHSARAIVNTRRICEDHIKGRYDLEVVDLARNPALASVEQIIAAPTLIRIWPLPLRRFIGDMSQTSRILAGLGVEADPARELEREATR